MESLCPQGPSPLPAGHSHPNIHRPSASSGTREERLSIPTG